MRREERLFARVVLLVFGVDAEARDDFEDGEICIQSGVESACEGNGEIGPSGRPRSKDRAEGEGGRESSCFGTDGATEPVRVKSDASLHVRSKSSTRSSPVPFQKSAPKTRETADLGMAMTAVC